MQARARRFTTRYFILLVAKAETPYSRIGFIITRKVEPGAVKRNRLRRRLREIFRLNCTKLTKKIDLVIIARQGATLREFSDVHDEILSSLAKGGHLVLR